VKFNVLYVFIINFIHKHVTHLKIPRGISNEILLLKYIVINMKINVHLFYFLFFLWFLLSIANLCSKNVRYIYEKYILNLYEQFFTGVFKNCRANACTQLERTRLSRKVYHFAIFTIVNELLLMKNRLHDRWISAAYRWMQVCSKMPPLSDRNH